MKFCRPVLRAVYKVDKRLAVSVFGDKKDAFHPIARKMIEKVRSLCLFYSLNVLTFMAKGSRDGTVMGQVMQYTSHP